MIEGFRNNGNNGFSEGVNAKEELSKLEETYAALHRVWLSLHYEGNSNSAARGAIKRAEGVAQEASDSLVSAHLNGKDVENAQKELENAASEIGDARLWADGLASSQTVRYTDLSKKEISEGVFANKLIELGVDIANAQLHYSVNFDRVDAAIKQRLFELQQRIMEKKTEIIGGTEELVAKAISNDKLLSLEKISRYKEALSRSSEFPTIGKVFDLCQANEQHRTQYPIVVQLGIIRQQVKAGVREGVDIEPLITALKDYLTIYAELGRVRQENHNIEYTLRPLQEKNREVISRIEWLSHAAFAKSGGTFRADNEGYLDILFGEEEEETRYRFLLPESVAEKAKTMRRISEEQLISLLQKEVASIQGEIALLNEKLEKEKQLTAALGRIGSQVVSS